MNLNEAQILMDNILDHNRAAAFSRALEMGIEYYRECEAGVYRLNEYHYTDVARRFLSASVYTAIDDFTWEDYAIEAHHDTQRSSHRTYLLFGEIWIDIIRDRRTEAEFYGQRFALNARPGIRGSRYALLNYSVESEGEETNLSCVELLIPRAKNTILVSRSLL